MLDGCTPWPPDFAKRYRAAGHWRGETLGDLLRQWSRRYGDRTALVHSTGRLTYAELDRRVDRMAAGFLRHGIAAGDRVVVQLPNAPEFIEVCFALFRIDAKPVFSLLAHRSNEIRHLCTLTDAVAYVVPGQHLGFDYLPLAAEMMTASPALRTAFVADGKIPEGDAEGFTALAEVDAEPGSRRFAGPDPSDVAFFLLSGGTTALPKLIPRTHDDYACQIRLAAGLVGLTSQDVYLAALPVEFNFAWGCPGVLGTLLSGGKVVLAETPVADDCFESVEREQVTFTSLVPALLQMWLESAGQTPCDLSSLRVIQIGGAPLHRNLAEQVAPAFDCRLQQVFGMAEGLLTLTRESDPPEINLTTQGRPLSVADEVRIVDEDGADLPPGRTGELLARGPYTLRGYYRAAEHNARAFTADGFYRTGDLARLTGTGELVIEGRIKDVIIRGGNKISVDEVEAHLLEHPAVDRAAVVPMPDPYLGERICAYIRPAGRPPALAELREALQAKGVAEYKFPDRVEIVADLPLTGLGKVDKKRLRRDAAGKAAG